MRCPYQRRRLFLPFGKYTLDCAAATAPPRLEYIRRTFLENGYQLPGTEDGATTGKKDFGSLTWTISPTIPGSGSRGNVLRSHHFGQQNPPTAEAGTVHNNSELGFPEVFSLFTAGTVTKNIGFFVEPNPT